MAGAIVTNFSVREISSVLGIPPIRRQGKVEVGANPIVSAQEENDP